MTSKRLQARARRAGRDMMLHTGAAATTIALRLPGLFTPQPTAKELTERRRMVSEKIEAAIEGVGEAQAAFGAFWIKAMFGGVRGPSDFFNGWADVAEAATKPAGVRVRANARRLKKGLL